MRYRINYANMSVKTHLGHELPQNQVVLPGFWGKKGQFAAKDERGVWWYTFGMDAKKLLWSFAGSILGGLGFLAGDRTYGEVHRIWTSGTVSSPAWMKTFLEGFFFTLAWICAGHWERNSAIQPVPRSHKFVILAVFFTIGRVFADAFAAWFGVAHDDWLLSLIVDILYGASMALTLVGFPYLAERLSLLFNPPRNEQVRDKLNTN